MTDPPERVGPYHLLGVIGEGGMGVVYEAEQHEPVKRRVALKMMKVGMDTGEVLARFEAERQALAIMDHPGIAKVHDAGRTEQGRPFFVMELVEGERIDLYCDRNRLTARQRVELFIRVCEAVQHAHQKGIIHRDLKPSNVLVSELDGRPACKIIDFGIARAVDYEADSEERLTRAGVVMGTPAYMSPEQLLEDSAAVDTRSDVYAVGVMLYETLIGALPREKDTYRGMGLLAAVLNDPRAPSERFFGLPNTQETVAADRGTDPSTLRRQLQGDLDWIVMKAIAAEPERRYDSISALAQDLSRFLRYEPVVARPPTIGYRLRKFVRRNRAAATAAAIGLVAVLGGATAAVVGMVTAQRAEAVATREAETATQVSAFMAEIFAAADPNMTRGATITAQEILDAGAERIRTELIEEPLVRAELMRILGDVYVSLGVFADGQSLHESALEIYATHGEAADTAVAWSQLALAYTLLWTGDFERADSFALAAMTGLEATVGKEHKLYGDAFDQLVNSRLASGRSTEDLMDEIVAQLESRRRNGLGEEVSNAMDHLCWSYLRANDAVAADSMCAATLEYRREYYGGEHPALISILGRVADARSLLGDGEGRLAAQLERVRVARAVFDGPHYETAAALGGVADAYQGLGLPSEALPRAGEALEMFREVLEPGHPEVLYAMGRVASGHAAQSDLAGAADSYREVVAERRRFGRTSDGQWVTDLNSWGFFAFRAGRLVEADSALHEALVFMEADRDELNQGRNIITTNYARVAAALGRSEEALRYARLAEERLSEVLGPDHWRAAAARTVRGRALTQQGDYEAASEALTESWEIMREAQPVGSAYRRDVLEYLIELSEARGRARDAERWRELLREETG